MDTHADVTRQAAATEPVRCGRPRDVGHPALASATGSGQNVGGAAGRSRSSRPKRRRGLGAAWTRDGFARFARARGARRTGTVARGPGRRRGPATTHGPAPDGGHRACSDGRAGGRPSSTATGSASVSTSRISTISSRVGPMSSPGTRSVARCCTSRTGRDSRTSRRSPAASTRSASTSPASIARRVGVPTIRESDACHRRALVGRGPARDPASPGDLPGTLSGSRRMPSTPGGGAIAPRSGTHIEPRAARPVRLGPPASHPVAGRCSRTSPAADPRVREKLQSAWQVS